MTDSNVTPLSIDVMRKTIGPEIEAARAATQKWLRADATPDFTTIAELAVPALQTPLERGWIQVDDEWSVRLDETFAIIRDPSDLRFRGRVAEVVELVWWALSPNRPPLPPRGPLAGEMSLGSKKP